MSVLCCYTPDFLINLYQRRHPHCLTDPLALLGPDDQICALSTPARQAGVQRGMKPQQAQMRCPDLHLQPLDWADCQAAQAAFLDVLARWELPVEEQSWGAAYLDLRPITRASTDVQSLAAALGRQLRTTLGETLQPALGWDHGKFTSRAAAIRTPPGHMKLVHKADEIPFLAPLSITLLPLPPATVQRLTWLGITTLGEFAQLPAQAVYQQFGKMGKLAQQWAQGRDDRPVRNTVRALFASQHIPIDPPTVLLDPVLQVLMAALAPQLQTMAAHLEGCRRLALHLTFTEGADRQVDLLCLEPISQIDLLQRLLTRRLQAVNWPGELSAVTITALERGELPMQQLALLPDLDGARSPLATVVEKLKARYGPVFWQGQLRAPTHPIAERRFGFVA